MVLHILRGCFILLATSVIALYVLPFQEEQQVEFHYVALLLGGTVAIAAAIVALDMFTREKKLSAVSGVFLGLIAGLIAAYALSFVVDLIGVLTAPPRDPERLAYLNLLQGIKVVIGLITCYIGISLVLQTKDDFRFVIPYVEFAKQIRGNRPIILDTSIIIDGRILDIIETKVLQGTLIVPRFVLNELQTVADSADKMKRARGRRGLDILQKLQSSHVAEVLMDDTDVEGANVDQKLISLAQHMRGRVMTNDFNLNKIASLRGVEVINLNDLAKAMRPVVLPGEHLSVKLMKPGENPSQGVGYLDDGTMVVVEDGKSHIGQQVDLVVTSTLQTSAGRMIFGRFDRTEADDSDGSGSYPREHLRSNPGNPPHPKDEPAAVDGDSINSGGPTRTNRPHHAGRNPRRPGR